MMKRNIVQFGCAFTATVALAAVSASAQQTSSGGKPVIAGESAGDHPMRLAMASQDKNAKPATTTKSEKTTVRTETKTVATEDYKEVSDFFNIREANSNVVQGEWELEFEGGWATGAGRDDGWLGASLKYGITNDLHIALELLPAEIGNGGEHGAGDTSIILFQQLTHEKDHWAALGTWAEMRIPSGDQSSGVDGAWHMTLTKTLAPCWRMNWDGYVMTANGDRGSDHGEDRRPFQYGLGPGFDYSFSDDTIGILNYLHRTSDDRGESNQNIVEVGVAHRLTPNQWVKAAVDFDVDWRDNQDHVGAKLLWSYSF
ncbi:MAG: hypothetical protein HY287_03330 [Planctomycetes bacterium]|nr:hypothetical protein [Planctomycetota bacterium]MBI3833344.1 hypothetical protein [Planctomycetota bacterium]